MTSPEKAAANRENAKKSTGPKSAEGKARSARNAVTHGLTADPGEPTEAYQETLREWIADLKPKDIAQRTVIERACRAAWSLKRCDRYEDATAAQRDRDAAERHDLAEAARAEAIGLRLIAVPSKADPNAGSTTACPRPEDDDPAALVGELRRTAAGVAWLLARWAELGRALTEQGGWDEAHGIAAVRLLGLRPESAGGHPLARGIIPATFDLSRCPGGGSWFGHPLMCGALEACVEASERGEGTTLELWTACLRAVASQARGEAESAPADAKKRKALVRSERAKLARLMARVLKGRAAEDRAGAADRSLFDDSRSLSLYLRYATAASRDLHRSIADLVKLRKTTEGEDEAPGPPPAPPAVDGDVPEPAAPDPEPAKNAPSRDAANLRNEATAAPAEPTSEGGIPYCAAGQPKRARVRGTGSGPVPW